MTETTLNLLPAVLRVFFIVLLVGACLTSAAAQSGRHGVPDTDKLMGNEGGKSFELFEEEMRSKQAIRIIDKEYQENLERAREISFLGSSLAASFKVKNSLDREDIKKLGKVEKLAKGIRNAAGGSDENVQLEKVPNDLASGLVMLESLSKSLKERVEKTPKRVISAAVIDEANVLLELIRVVRTLPPKV